MSLQLGATWLYIFSVGYCRIELIWTLVIGILSVFGMSYVSPLYITLFCCSWTAARNPGFSVVVYDFILPLCVYMTCRAGIACGQNNYREYNSRSAFMW